MGLQRQSRASRALGSLLVLSVVTLVVGASCTGSADWVCVTPLASASDSAELRAAYIASRQADAGPSYALERQPDGSLAGRLPAQGLRVTATVEGVVRLAPDTEAAAWSVGLRLRQMGRAGALDTTAPVSAAAMTNGREAPNVVRFVRENGIEEWYASGPLGVEQGFAVAWQPADEGHGDLVLQIEVDGLEPLARSNGVALQTPSGTAVLQYTDLFARDANGTKLPARMSVEGARLSLVIGDAGARYPITIDPLVWAEQDQLTALDGDVGDSFGASVSVSNDTAVVGAPGDDVGGAVDCGSAYVFVRSGNSWSLEQKLNAFGLLPGDEFGTAVSVSGDTVVVGSPGRDVTGKADQGTVYVFVRSAGSWSQQDMITASDGAAGDNFGAAVALSGDTLVVGAAQNDVGANPDQGSTYVFVRNAGVWSEQQILTADDGAANDAFGTAVSLSGTTTVVGAAGDDGPWTNQGSVYVFVQNGNAWSKQQKLVAADGTAQDRFGVSVGVSADTTIIGAAGDDVAGLDSGSAYVFLRNGIVWSFQQKLTASDAEARDEFGSGVTVVGDVAIVGAMRDTIAANAYQGSAYAFLRSSSTWSEHTKLAASTGAIQAFFGGNVALSFDTAIVGARGDTVGVNPAQGSAYLYVFRKSQGDACGAPNECVSAICTDGVCCDAACDGTCEACVATKSGGVDGVCGAVTVNTDPDAECGGVGSCDGHGVCKLANAQACAIDADCLSDHCVDGFCCDSVCDAVCEACAAAKNGATDGLCGPVPINTDPDGDCDAATTCSADGVLTVGGRCDGAGVCVDSSMPCAPYRCTVGGACLASCITGSDCVGGNVCSADGKCVAPPSALGDENGCACSLTARSGAGGHAWAWLLAAAALLIARTPRFTVWSGQRSDRV